MAKKILVVDNDSDFVEAVAGLLAVRGYEVTGALDGEAGFDRALSYKPDLILLDVMMKHVSEGLDVAVKLRDSAQTSRIPVLLITGIHKPAFLAESYRPGEDWPNLKGTMEKPVKPAELLEKVGKILGK